MTDQDRELTYQNTRTLLDNLEREKQQVKEKLFKMDSDKERLQSMLDEIEKDETVLHTMLSILNIGQYDIVGHSIEPYEPSTLTENSGFNQKC